jgi:thiol-disulfide isomerase/thioredoxin
MRDANCTAPSAVPVQDALQQFGARSMKSFVALLGWLALAALAAAPAQAASEPPSSNVAWLAAANDADIGRAFAKARAEKKPVLLYWGATWCPPCNQLKATLFNRQDFASLARSFVAVNVDGDRPGAQKLGQRFKVSGYPTTVLFTADGAEITRLPGEVDAPQALAVLQLGLAGGRPAKAVLADALAGRPLAPTEWRLLAFYAWETDEQQLVPRADVPATLVRLAAAGPADDNETTTRLWLKALAASDDSRGVKPDAALRDRVLRVLADPTQARAHMDVLTNSATEMVRAFEGDAEPVASPSPLALAFDAALKRLQSDMTLSRADRFGALAARVDLARIHQAKDATPVKMPEALLQELRDQVARADREINDGYERQAVITAAGHSLAQAGLWAESEALLTANLAKSHSPYYLMSQLASNARKQGHNEDALRWYGQAFAKSQGPATRLQWGSSYVQALVDLAPQDGPRIEKTAAQLLAEAGRDKGSFEGRSARSLQRASTKLVAWGAATHHAAALRRLQSQRDALCAKVDAAQGQRATCSALLKAKAGTKPAV